VQYFILLYIHMCKPSFQLHHAKKENHGKWRQAGENEDVWITMRATTSWHAKYGKDDDDDDLCEDWRDEVENWAYTYEYTRE
jgi:hypothetical protein